MQKEISLWITIGLLFICSVASVSVAQTEHTEAAHSWTYSGEHGPKHWGELNPEFAACATGKEQSPIDITHPETTSLPRISFEYRSSPLKIIDNGHTVQVNYASGSTISVGDNSYELVQFHFHHPSEEEINGKRHAMVAHLVHKNKAGKLAVVAVLIDEGNANPLISTLWKNLPTEKGKEVTRHDIKVNASDLLPSDHKYYTFAGSLTTPPCSENVTWYVLETPIYLSRAQIDRFARVYRLNARPVQALNGRIVRASR
jgi:carbonic anhydrase